MAVHGCVAHSNGDEVLGLCLGRLAPVTWLTFHWRKLDGDLAKVPTFEVGVYEGTPPGFEGHLQCGESGWGGLTLFDASASRLDTPI